MVDSAHMRPLLLISCSVLTCAYFLVVPQGMAASSPIEPIITTLSNGMRTIVVPKHGAPVVAVQVWVHVGSKDEDASTRGLAHIQEHMLFQGTKQYGSGTIFKTVQSVGGDMNAFTDYDETVYYITLPKEKIATALAILSSMMHEASIAPEQLKKELEVVMEEFRRDTQDPGRMLHEAVTATAFREHPYRHPVIGYKDTIEQTTVDQVRNFYTRWYVPENMTLIIVGDVDTKTLEPLISQTFEKIPSRKNPKRDIAPEPPQNDVRSVVVQGSFENASLNIAIRAPKYTEDDAPAMDVLMSILGTGQSSRLVQNVKERDHLVSNIGAAYYSVEQQFLSMIEADIESKNSVRALTAILRELERLKHAPVLEQELNRAKVQLQAAVHFKEQSYDGAAKNLGYQIIAGGRIDSEAQYLKKVATVTPLDLQEIARKYFIPKNLTVGFLYPNDDRNTLSRQRIATTVNRALKLSTKDVKSLPAHVASLTFDHSSGVTKVRMVNGLTLLVREDHSTKTFSAQALLLGGVRLETAATNGVSTFLSRMLLRGTTRLNQSDIASKLDTMAASISPFSDRNTFGLSLSSLSTYSTETLSLLHTLFTESTFPKDQIENVRSQLLDGLARKKDNPFLLSFQQLNRGVYGSHPYGLPQDGSLDVIKRLNRSDLEQFAAKNIRPRNMVIAIAGDVSTDQIIEMISSSFGAMTDSGDAAFAALPVNESAGEQKVLTSYGQYSQANIFLAFPTFALDHSDRYALAVADSILGSEGGRLFSHLRDQESLAYSVQGFIINGLKTPGFYALYLGCAPEKTDRALESLEREVQNIVKDGVTDKEVSDAVNSIAGTYVVGLQTPDAQAHLLAVSERFGLGFDDYLHFVERIRAVTKEDVHRIAKTYFDRQKATLSIVRPVEVK